MAIYDSITALTWGQLGCLAVAVWLVYAAALAIHRLWLSPIAHLPGPRLAALTRYYEFYYDVLLGGQYMFRIMEMHKEYGAIIRVSPWEVHVADPDFHAELYGGPSHPRDKWDFHAKQAWLWSRNHRPPPPQAAPQCLGPFFLNPKRSQPAAGPGGARECALGRAHEVGDDDQGAAAEYHVPARGLLQRLADVINEYAFARCDHLIEKPDFGREVADNLLTGTHMGMLVKHMNRALTLVNSLPEPVSGRWVPGWGGFLKMKKDIVAHISDIKASENTDKWQLDVSHPTIFHELLSSKKLPPEEKTPARLAQEGQVLVQGGTLTASWTLTVAAFHLLHRPAALRKLRDELFAAIPDADQVTPLAKLESLPYLRGVVKEALRLSIGTSGRLPRIAPTETLVFRDRGAGAVWQLPPGTVVSMSPSMVLANEDVFPEPLGFHPERWLDDGDRLDRYLHVFGGGTRTCLGMALASAELHMTLAKLFRRWGGGGTAHASEDGDRRPGDAGVLKIYKSTPRDCQMASDFFIPIPYKVRDDSDVVLGDRSLTGRYRVARGSGSCWRQTDGEARRRREREA
ncbi:Trichodiene oxygenase [Tolypocladium capitatum]|uniref:Trichodiene oxygenase n=1 Tax=Tolypocladium capitatum TaxID=45235 RepID=A0A2K3QQX2_9HYPO|nr:Trichodiene oxygenase [Tolypocladium capitatum]